MKRIAYALAAALAASITAGCGSGGGPATPTVSPARTFELAGFQPAGTVRPRTPVRVSFAIRQPSGQILTTYRRGPGPHTRIHLIFVRDDLRGLIHRHPPLAEDGTLADTVTFPAAGRYRLVVDAFPQLAGNLRNFQLFRTIRVGEQAARRPLPPFRATVMVDGYRVSLEGGQRLRAIQPAFLTVSVRDPNGRPASFKPYFGALAHAIFFRGGDLSYFHTHVCGPGAVGCTTTFGGTSVAGTATAAGRLRVGVLLPVAGTWRLFLQFRTGGRVITAPFTLRVR